MQYEKDDASGAVPVGDDVTSQDRGTSPARETINKEAGPKPYARLRPMPRSATPQAVNPDPKDWSRESRQKKEAPSAPTSAIDAALAGGEAKLTLAEVTSEPDALHSVEFDVPVGDTEPAEHVKTASRKRVAGSGSIVTQAIAAAVMPKSKDAKKVKAADRNRAQRRKDAKVSTTDAHTSPPVAGYALAQGDNEEADGEKLLFDLDDLQGEADKPDDPVFGALEPGIVGALYGEAGISKSTIAVHIAVAVAGGVEFAGIKAPFPQPVVVFSPEDSTRIIGRRVLAAIQEVGADPVLVKKNLRVVKFDQPVALLEKTEAGQQASIAGTRLFKQIREHKARLAILDPLVELHNADENNNAEMHSAFRVFRSLSMKARCAILVTHHTAKDNRSGPSVSSGRGAGSMGGAVRFIMTALSLGVEEAKPYLGKGVTSRDLFKIDLTKASYHRCNQPQAIFKRVSLEFGSWQAPALRKLN